MKFLLPILFCFTITAYSFTDYIATSEEDVDRRCRVRVDCDGDGQTDYEGTTSCEHAGALAYQYQESCG